jgi:aminopeptidase N
MRDFDITASPALQKASKTYDGVIVNSYYLPADAADGKQVLDWAGKAVEVYQKRIGAYPFTELDVVETPTTAGGIEYPGLVVISNKLYHDPEQSRALEFAVVHEVAHQWFYSLVGDDQVNTPWMDEALVQMVALLYEQDVNGAQAADFIRQRVFQSGYDRAKQQNEDMPIGLAVSAYTDRQYGEIVYGKGPLFFDALREKIGDAKFNQFLSTYFQRYKYKNARPQDLLQVMTEVGGSEVEPLYDQWVLGR